MIESFVKTATTLREAGLAKGVLMGSEFNLNHKDDATYEDIFGAEYAIGTAENACKWGAIRPSQDEYNLQPCIDHFKFALENTQEFRGHNLCWGQWNPKWLDDFSGSSEELDSILKDHITTVMQGVRKGADNAKILAWDVVNEAISDDSNEMFKSNAWYPKIPDYVERAFKYARQADPDALLFYNDYNIVWDGKKTDHIVDMIKDFQEKKVPIDGIGMQFHVDADANLDRQKIASVIKRFGDLGLQVHITELDAKCSKCTSGD